MDARNTQTATRSVIKRRGLDPVRCFVLIQWQGSMLDPRHPSALLGPWFRGGVLESPANQSMSPTYEQSLRQVLEATPGVRLAVLFGSAARGDLDESSDLDVGVSFESGGDSGSRLEVEMSRISHRRVDLVRLDEAPPLLRFEIARDGRLLLERIPHAWADFKARAMVDWWDWAPLARALHASAVKRVREGLGRGTP